MAGTQPADVFVVFGITGDLARVMTFQALYRLERRGLLDCPILGVAGDDWTIDQLREHARKCIADTGESIDDEIFNRFAARLSYVSGDFGDDSTYERVGSALSGARSPVFYLEIPPSLFGMVIEGLARVGVTQSARVVVEKPFGHDVASARALNEEVHQHLDESQLYRIDHFLGYKGLDEIRYLRFANTMFEPIWNRNYISSVQLTMAETFGVDGRGHFYDPVGALRDVVVNHLMQVVATTAMEPPAGGDPSTLGERDGLGLPGHSRPPTRRTTCAVSTTATARSRAWLPTRRRRPTRLCSCTSTTGAGPGCRSSSAPARTCRPTVTELRLVFKHPPRLGFLPEGTRRPEPDQLIVRLYPTTGIRLLVDAQRADVEQPEQVSLDLEFSEQGGEGATPYEVLLHAAMIGDSRRFKRQDSVEETWRIMQPLLDAPPPVHAYKKGSWGPGAADAPRRRARSLARAVGVGMSATTDADAAERGRPLAVPADRRLRLPLGLPHQRARGAGRLDRLAVRAALRLTERVRLPARPPGRLVPAWALRDQRARPPGSTSRAPTSSPPRGRRPPAGSSCATP